MEKACPYAADRQSKELTRLQESIVVLEDHLERAQKKIEQIMAEARLEKEMVQMVPGSGSGFRNDLLVVSRSRPERGRSCDVANENPVVDRFYDEIVGHVHDAIPMNSVGLARRASSLTTRAFLRHSRENSRARSVEVDGRIN